MCGEQALGSSARSPPRGSPPRVRGTVIQLFLVPCRVRITPACAGNSTSVQKKGLLDGDHPRVCGEQYLRHRLALNVGGSPPRVRGTVRQRLSANGAKGITPACAGNSAFLAFNIPNFKDHPRVCGEQLKCFSIQPGKAGSPPRVRGTEQAFHRTLPRQGITPACAGNRNHRLLPVCFCKDHPRVCGEQGHIVYDNPGRGGSPPRVRGTELIDVEPLGIQRITPACAGNSAHFVSYTCVN